MDGRTTGVLVTTVLNALRKAKRRAQWKTAPARREQSPATPVVGNDGLTDGERLQDLVTFRSGVGSRPAYNDELQALTEVMSEKLAGSGRLHRSTR